MPGQPVIVPAPTTYEGLIDRIKNCSECMCINWYLCFKNDMNSNMATNPSMFCNDNIRLNDTQHVFKSPKEISN